MGGIREYQFDNQFETSQIPSGDAPVASGDLVSYGFAEERYTHKDNVGGVLEDINALKALDSGATERVENQIYFIIGVGYYYWDPALTTAGDDDEIVTPDDITEPAPGRWVLEASAGGGSGGSGGMANLYLLEQKMAAEDSNIFGAAVPNSVAESFNRVQSEIISYLWENYTSGTAMVLVHDPKFLESGDEDTDSATNWSAQGAGATLTASNTAGDFKVGTHGLKFDKDNSATNARIRHAAAAATQSIAGFTDVLFWIKLPSITNLTNIEIRIDVDGTNYETYTATTDHKGNALAVGWQLMKFNVAVAGTSSGTGWDKSKLFRYFHVGVNTSSSAQTYTGIIVDGVVFSRANPELLGIKTYKKSIYDTSNLETLIVSSASTREVGEITLAAGLSNAYTAGYKAAAKAQLKRNTHSIENGIASMVDGLSGAVADTQTSRKTIILPQAVSSANFIASIGWGTDMMFKVTSVVDSDTVEVEDTADSTANIVSGRVFDVYQTVIDPEGQEHYVPRNLSLTVSSSSHSSGTTTVNTGTNTGIAVGDLIVMRQVANERISCVGVTSNEDFQALNVTERLCYNKALPYPKVTQVMAHWHLGGKNTTVATKNNKSSVGAAGALTVTGSPNLNVPFLTGLFGAGSFSDSDYLSHPAAGIGGISSDDATSGGTGIFSFSCWVFFTALPGAVRYFLSKSNSSQNGWETFIQTTGTFGFVVNTNQIETSNSIVLNKWNHVALAWDENAGANGNSMWLNGVEKKLNGASNTDSGEDLRIGRRNGAGNPFTGGSLAQLVFWQNFKINQAIVDAIYNEGNPRPLGNFPQMITRYDLNALSGQKLSVEADTIRTTDASDPFLDWIVAVAS